MTLSTHTTIGVLKEGLMERAFVAQPVVKLAMFTVNSVSTIGCLKHLILSIKDHLLFYLITQ